MVGPVLGKVTRCLNPHDRLANTLVVVKWRGGLGGVHGHAVYLLSRFASRAAAAMENSLFRHGSTDVIFGDGPILARFRVDALGMDKPIEYTAYKAGYVIEQPVYPIVARDNPNPR